MCRVVPPTLIHGPSSSAESQFATHCLVKLAWIATPGVKVAVGVMKQTHAPVGAAPPGTVTPSLRHHDFNYSEIWSSWRPTLKPPRWGVQGLVCHVKVAEGLWIWRMTKQSEKDENIKKNHHKENKKRKSSQFIERIYIYIKPETTKRRSRPEQKLKLYFENLPEDSIKISWSHFYDCMNEYKYKNDSYIIILSFFSF